MADTLGEKGTSTVQRLSDPWPETSYTPLASCCFFQNLLAGLSLFTVSLIHWSFLDTRIQFKGCFMRRARCFAGMVAMLFVVTLHADAPVATPPVEKLIEQLADSDFQVRDKAARAIEALGVEALPALKKAREHADPEVRRRIEQWIPALERALVLSPKAVTIKLTNRPIREAYEALAKQTGYKIELGQDAEREKQVFSFDLNKTPFWEALDKLCEAAGVVLQQGYGNENIHLQFQDRYTPFVHRSGPFRLVAQGFDYGRSVQFGSLPKTPNSLEQPQSEYLRFNFNIAVEPKLPLLGIGEAKLTEALDDQKQSMAPMRNGNVENVMVRRGSYWYGGYRSNNLSTQVALAMPAKSARFLKVIKGTVPLTLLAEQKTFVVSKEILKAKGQKLTAGSTIIEILEVTPKQNKQCEIKMSVRQENKDGGVDYNWINSLYNRIELQDDKGNKFAIYGSSTSTNGNHAQLTYNYAPSGNAGAPTQLVYHDWVTLQHELQFEFKDLPLP